MEIINGKGGIYINKDLKGYLTGKEFLNLFKMKNYDIIKKLEINIYTEEAKEINLVLEGKNYFLIPYGLFYYYIMPFIVYIMYKQNLKIEFKGFDNIDYNTSPFFNFKQENFKFEDYQKEFMNNHLTTSQAYLSFNEFVSYFSYGEGGLSGDYIKFNEYIPKDKLKEAFKYMKEDNNLSFFFQSPPRSGFDIAPAGSGKTLMILGLIQQMRRKSLIVVNKDFIPEQFLEAIKKFTDLDENDVVIYKGKSSLNKQGKIAIAMVNTLYSSFQRDEEKDIYFRDEILPQYDNVFFDESHNVATPTYKKVFYHLKSNFLYGFTATKSRSDGNAFLLNSYIGEDIYNMPFEKVESRVHKVNIYPSYFYYNGCFNFMKKIKTKKDDLVEKQTFNDGLDTLGKIDERNNKILNMLRRAVKDNRMIIVLSHRIKHLTILKDWINQEFYGKYGYNIAFQVNATTNDSSIDSKEFQQKKKEITEKWNKYKTTKDKEIREDIKQQKNNSKMGKDEKNKYFKELREQKINELKEYCKNKKEEDIQQLKKDYNYDRNALLEKFKESGEKRANGEEFQYKILLSTYSLLKEAFDGPYFDTMFLTMPLGAKKKKVSENSKEEFNSTHGLIQTINRISRRYEGKKTPTVIDMVDIENPNSNYYSYVASNIPLFMFFSRYFNVYSQLTNVNIENIDIKEIKRKYGIN